MIGTRSLREMTATINLEDFWCWNEDCPDYGKKGQGNIQLHDRKGGKDMAILKCKTCKQRFSERRGTFFFGLRTPKAEILRALSLLPEKGSIRAVSRVTGFDKGTIVEWIKLAGKQAKLFNEHFLRDLELTEVQVDEIWAYIKKTKKRQTQRS
jgi:hypothetical protein